MSSRKRKRLGALPCAELHPDDGVDPRTAFRREPGPRRGGRKTLQLCRQVGRALEVALAECGDPLVRELILVDVVPDPDQAHLAVVLQLPAQSRAAPKADVLVRLAVLHGRLRSTVAGAITRKRTAELSFRVL